ncbi:hypothetical protein SNE40_010106 [Patella caerulea]|uniref:Uncharacterized protein n=1 Tax=Patella caerulea TaxID=87958 RepID=A0AAN8JTI4_PATCE
MLVNDGLPTIALISSNIGLVRSLKTTTLNGRHHVDLPVRIDNGKIILLEPSPILAKNSILGAKCLDKVENGKSVLRLLNPTKKDIQISKTKILATVNDIKNQ